MREILVVTTPQMAAAEVAERAGAIALQTRQRIAGVVENMSGLQMPDGTVMQLFGEGGGRQVADSLTRSVGAEVPLLGQVPLDPALVAAGDSGVPLVLSAPESAAGAELRKIAEGLSARKRGLAGMSLGLDTAAPLGGVGVERRFSRPAACSVSGSGAGCPLTGSRRAVARHRRLRHCCDRRRHRSGTSRHLRADAW